MATDFSKGKRGPVVPPDPNKTRITEKVARGIQSPRTLINNVLRDHIEARDEKLETKLRQIVREELKRAG